MFINTLCRLLLVFATVGPGLALASDTLPAPSGEVLLEISGKIEHTNAGDAAHWDLAMLESLPVTSFKTSTPWSEGVFEFTGVRLNTLLEAVGAQSDRFMASATDDYEVVFGDVDLETYPIILAYKQDGHYISVRELGPLRIMLPFDDHPELHTQNNLTMTVWQLLTMEVL